MLKLNHLTGFGSGATAAGAAGDVTSYVFGGDGDYLTLADHADWDFADGDFTIDLWYRPDGGSANDDWLVSHRADASNYHAVAHAADGSYTWQIVQASGSFAIWSTTGLSTDNVWQHVAFVRSGDNYYIFVDGVDRTNSGSPNSTTVVSINGTLYIAFLGHGTEEVNGYIDEVRISDTARWTSGFTPETSQYTSDANTLLLIHGGGAYTGPLTGETTQSCVTFDGSGDYLSVADHADWDWGTPTSDWTIEAWVNPVTAGSQTIWYQGIEFGVHSSGVAVWYGIGGAPEATGTTSLTDGLWHHVAAVRSGTDVFLYTDGGDKQTVDVTGDDHNRTAGPFIGSTSTATDYNGQIAEVRVSNTARYTGSTFVLETTRFTSDANTKLLIHGDEYFTNWASGTTGSGATFTDSGNTGHTVTEVGNAISARGGTFTDSGNTGHTVSENGNAQRVTDVEYKLTDDGVGYRLDGAGDYLEVPNHADWGFGTSDFTIELWVRFNVLGATEYIFGQWDDSTDQWYGRKLNDDRLQMQFINSGGAEVARYITTSKGISSANEWHHVVFQRREGASPEGEIYVNGVLQTLTENVAFGANSLDTKAANVRVGAYITGTDLNGYMDEVRISDIARYTTGFTPSSTQFSSDANTLLLIHGGEAKSGTTGSGATFTDSGNTGHTVTEVGTAIESTGNLYKF